MVLDALSGSSYMGGASPSGYVHTSSLKQVDTLYTSVCFSLCYFKTKGRQRHYVSIALEMHNVARDLCDAITVGRLGPEYQIDFKCYLTYVDYGMVISLCQMERAWCTDGKILEAYVKPQDFLFRLQSVRFRVGELSSIGECFEFD